MKNKLTDLNDHLFAQLERLSDEDLSEDKIEQECKRADAIVSVSDQILSGANTQLKAATLLANHGDRFAKMLPSIGGTTTSEILVSECASPSRTESSAPSS